MSVSPIRRCIKWSDLITVFDNNHGISPGGWRDERRLICWVFEFEGWDGDRTFQSNTRVTFRTVFLTRGCFCHIFWSKRIWGLGGERIPIVIRVTTWSFAAPPNYHNMEDTAHDQSRRPDAPVQTESFRKARAAIVGGEVPKSPFPIRLSGEVQHGFKRGSRELGCHTGMSW